MNGFWFQLFIGRQGKSILLCLANLNGKLNAIKRMNKGNINAIWCLSTSWAQFEKINI